MRVETASLSGAILLIVAAVPWLSTGLLK